MKNFDVVVIGAGTGGQTAAMELAAEGYKVAMIEASDEPGGICALHGCQAKKWFYEAAETVARCNHLQDRGILSQPKVDWNTILQQKNKFTEKIADNTVANLKGYGITYFNEHAVFIDHTTIKAGSVTIQAQYFIIATGAYPVRLPFEGSEHIITSNDFLALKSLPERIGFIGGGFISFEFAHFAARLGSTQDQLHILEANDRVLGPFDNDIVDQLAAASKEEGIIIHTGIAVEKITRSDTGFEIILSSSDSITVDLVVNGAGRIPNIDQLDLEAAGVEFGRKGIVVDQYMKTSNKNIFAVGDCAATLQLARVADMEGKTAARTILSELEGDQKKPVSYSAVPAVLFTYPQLGMVGKTEQELQEDGIKYWKTEDYNLSFPTYRRLGLRHCSYKILVDENNKILGAHFLSDNTTGLVYTFALAMRQGMSVDQLHENSILAPYPSRESDILYMLSPLLD